MIFRSLSRERRGTFAFSFVISWGKQFPLKRIWLYSQHQGVDGMHKLVNILKALVNRRVTQVSHLINPRSFFKHFRANH